MHSTRMSICLTLQTAMLSQPSIRSCTLSKHLTMYLFEPLAGVLDFLACTAHLSLCMGIGAGTGRLNGRSEQLLGRFIAGSPTKRRDDVLIATKLAAYPWRVTPGQYVSACRFVWRNPPCGTSLSMAWFKVAPAVPGSPVFKRKRQKLQA